MYRASIVELANSNELGRAAITLGRPPAQQYPPGLENEHDVCVPPVAGRDSCKVKRPISAERYVRRLVYRCVFNEGA